MYTTDRMGRACRGNHILIAAFLSLALAGCGSGVCTSDNTSCEPGPAHLKWAMYSGSLLANQKGSYGTLGTASASNVPGARFYSCHWLDTAGNLWLFGGQGYDATGSVVGFLNDLWKFDGTNWTWMAGSSS